MAYARSGKRAYTLIISPKEMSNRALGETRRGAGARAYMLTPQGLFKADGPKGNQLPITDEESVTWEFVVAWSVVPATGPSSRSSGDTLPDS